MDMLLRLIDIEELDLKRNKGKEGAKQPTPHESYRLRLLPTMKCQSPASQSTRTAPERHWKKRALADESDRSTHRMVRTRSWESRERPCRLYFLCRRVPSLDTCASTRCHFNSCIGQASRRPFPVPTRMQLGQAADNRAGRLYLRWPFLVHLSRIRKGDIYPLFCTPGHPHIPLPVGDQTEMSRAATQRSVTPR